MTRRALQTLPPACWGFALAAALVLLPRAASGQLQNEAQAQGSSASTPASGSTADTYHVHGIVLDAHTGRPISRAVVEAYGGRLAAFTDHDGRFALTLHFTSVAGGGMSQMQRGIVSQQAIFLGLTANKPGYVNGPVQRQFQQVSLSALDHNLIVKLMPESAIQGRVAATGDDHPEGVRVALLSRRVQEGSAQWAMTMMVSTNSRGEFRFSGLQPGRYRLMTQDWSDDPDSMNLFALAQTDKPISRYAPVSYPGGGTGDSEADLKLAAGETEQVNFNLHPQTYFPVRIPVVVPAGGNGGVQSRVSRPGSIEDVQSSFYLRYNARDKVVEGVLPTGSYEVALQSNGPNASAATVQLTVGGSRTETAPVTLLPMASVPVIIHQNLTRAAQSGGRDRLQGGIIAGFRGGSDFAASAVQVLLIPQQASGSPTVISRRRSGSEETTLEQVAPGTYRVEINANGGYVAAATSGGTDLLRQPLVVSPGSGVEPIEITLRDDTGVIRGTIDPAILDPASSALPNGDAGSDSSASEPFSTVFVSCIPSEPTARRLVQSIVQRDGRFFLGGIPPGSYKVFASHVPIESLEYGSEGFQREYGAKGYSVTLEPNGTASVTLTSVIEEQEP